MKTKIITLLCVIALIILQASTARAWPLLPVADAGSDQTVGIGTTVNFDGSGSYDPDGGDIVAYSWEFGSDAYDISGADTATPSCRFKATGGKTITLYVTDDEIQMDQDSCTITVSKPSAENTESDRWGTGLWATIHGWSVQLKPTALDFSGLGVTEGDYGEAEDTCWFADSEYSRVTGVSGGDWDVEPGNYLNDNDWVGWRADVATYYQDEGKAPCEFTMYQLMYVVLPIIGDEVSYTANILKGIILTNHVGSQRAGEVEYRYWNP